MEACQVLLVLAFMCNVKLKLILHTKLVLCDNLVLGCLGALQHPCTNAVLLTSSFDMYGQPTS